MKLSAVVGLWVGNLFSQFIKAFENLDIDVNYIHITEPKRNLVKKLYLNHIVDVRDYITKKEILDFNKKLFDSVYESKPDLLFVMNETGIETLTLAKIKNSCKCKTAVWIADNPFDSSRFTYLPMNLKFFDYIFVSDGIWIPQIEKVAPFSQVIKIVTGGGYDKTKFYDEPLALESAENKWANCSISFTGESYNLKAEGAYRAQILDYVSRYDLKFWGDAGWKLRFKYHPNLKSCYQGGRLQYDELRKLYKASLINLNMPAPQIITGFQPRVFEIAACKGFQIVDWREELNNLFSDEELVTFKSIPDLLEKIEYFVKYPEKRIPYIEKMYAKVWDNYSWEQRAKEIIEYIHF
jgi:spore maturation protein CgeB